jgi:RND family efflux transporter MFP subunit
MQTNDMQPAEPKTNTGMIWLLSGRKWTSRIALLLVVAACSLKLFPPGKASAKSDFREAEISSVAAARVVRQDLSKMQVFDAEFRPFEEIDLHAKVTGFVQELKVDVGDKVKAGQAIAVLEIPELADDLEHAQAVEKRSVEEVRKAEAAHEEAHLGYTRLAAVDKARPHLVAQQEIDLAVAKDRGAEAAMEGAKQQVEVARADVKKLRTMMNYSRITAPFEGVVTRRYADPGALVQGNSSSSMPIVRLSNNERLRLVFPVSVSFAHLIKAGEPVEIQIRALNKKIQGTISRFTRKIETNTRTMEVEVDVPNADLELLPGMYASAAIDLERKQSALAVPVEAVSRQKTTTVYVINNKEEIEERPISLGLETPSQLEVLGGLQENELVMLGSRALVKPGQRVLAKILEGKKPE